MESFDYTPKIEKTKTKNLKIGIVVSNWNKQITNNLLKETIQTLTKYGVKESNISKTEVPGSFELIFASKKIGQKKNIDVVITIGCIIKGETPHFEYISNSVATGIKDLNLLLKKPVIFGVLTTKNIKQAINRSSGKTNKGQEFAISALEMAKI